MCMTLYRSVGEGGNFGRGEDKKGYLAILSNYKGLSVLLHLKHVRDVNKSFCVIHADFHVNSVTDAKRACGIVACVRVYKYCSYLQQ